MDWQIGVTVVAAVLGSTGIAGTLTGGFQLTRRARLRRTVEKSADVLARLDAESYARSSLSRAIDSDVLQLSALTLVSFPGDLRRLFRLMLAFSGVYIGLVAVLVGYSDPAPVSDPTDPKIVVGWLIGFLGLIFSTAMALNALLRARRERFIELVTNGAEPHDALKELGERSAVVRVLDWITNAPFKLGELLAAATVGLLRLVFRLPSLAVARRSSPAANREHEGVA